MIDGGTATSTATEDEDGQRRESTSSDLDFSLRGDGDSEPENSGGVVGNGDKAGGSLKIPKAEVKGSSNATGGSSPPSSCDSGVVVVEPPPSPISSIDLSSKERVTETNGLRLVAENGDASTRS